MPLFLAGVSSLFLDRVPPPQVTEQFDQLLHCPHSQSTAESLRDQIKKNIKLDGLLLADLYKYSTLAWRRKTWNYEEHFAPGDVVTVVVVVLVEVVVDALEEVVDVIPAVVSATTVISIDIKS